MDVIEVAEVELVAAGVVLTDTLEVLAAEVVSVDVLRAEWVTETISEVIAGSVLSVESVVTVTTVTEVITDTAQAVESVETIETEAITDQLVQVEIVTIGTQGPQGPRGIPGPAGGSAVQCVAGELITGHRAVVLMNGLAWLYSPANPLHADLYYGISLSTATVGAEVTVQRLGEIEESAWSFAPGVVLATNSGLLVQSETPGEPLLIVGMATSGTHLVLSARTPIFT